MKKVFTPLLLLCVTAAFAQTKPAPTLKSILLEQLRTTHNVKDWFVPVNIAIDGLTPEQASWKDNSGNHSIGQLTNHLIFWDMQQLSTLKGEKPAPFSGDNNETFNSFNKENWKAAVQRIDSVLTALEKLVESADDKKIQAMASAIAHISAHNAYHIGQILYIRKLQGSWDPEKGVK